MAIRPSKKACSFLASIESTFSSASTEMLKLGFTSNKITVSAELFEPGVKINVRQIAKTKTAATTDVPFIHPEIFLFFEAVSIFTLPCCVLQADITLEKRPTESSIDAKLFYLELLQLPFVQA